VIEICKHVQVDALTHCPIDPLGEHRPVIHIARAISLAERGESYQSVLSDKRFIDAITTTTQTYAARKTQQNSNARFAASYTAPVFGITGTGGAGKSSVTDEIVRRYLNSFTDKTVAVISVDPSRKKTGGALLGDRIRMNAINHPRAYMRSLATRDDNTALSAALRDAIAICQQAAFDLIIIETAGVGQSDASILDHCQVSMYVMTPEYGAATQLEKINMLDYADLICLNKFDKAGAL
ncbi:MAG: GTP-binding protein, partial [Methylophilaceae bacterium]